MGEGCLGGKQYCKGGSLQLRGIAESEGNTFETIVSLHHNWQSGILSYFLLGISSEIKGLLLDRGRGR